MYEILLTLYANNFFSLANYIALILLIYAIHKKNFCLIKLHSKTFGILFLASTSYLAIYSYHYGIPETSTLFLRFINPVILFYIGYLRGMDGVEIFKREILFMGVGGFLHGIMNVFTNRSVNVLLVEGRQYADIYGGVVSATLQNLLFVIMSGTLFYFLVCEKRKWLKILGVIMALGGVYSSVENASRTMIYVTIIVFFATLFCYLYFKYGFGNAVVRFAMVAISVVIVVAIILWADLFGVREMVAETALGRRTANASVSSSISDNLRWMYASDILKLLPQNLMGDIQYDHYAHNLWVDIAKEAGIIPFILYIVFVVCAFCFLFRFVGNKIYTNEEKVLIIPVMLSLLMVFFTEPIMIGSPLTFSLFCFLAGGVESLSLYQADNSIPRETNMQ